MPETPLFLLSRNRQEDALKSLQWLRGWVDAATVQNEFNDLQRSRITAQICYQCEKQNEICQHPPPTMQQKIRDLFRRRTLRPFVLISCLFFFAAFCGLSPYRPYLVQILFFYQSPIDPNEVIVHLGYTGLFSNILLIFTIRALGKRSIYLWTMAFIVLSLFGLGMLKKRYCMNRIKLHIFILQIRCLRFYIPFVGFNFIRYKHKHGSCSRKCSTRSISSNSCVSCTSMSGQFWR